VSNAKTHHSWHCRRRFPMTGCLKTQRDVSFSSISSTLLVTLTSPLRYSLPLILFVLYISTHFKISSSACEYPKIAKLDENCTVCVCYSSSICFVCLISVLARTESSFTFFSKLVISSAVQCLNSFSWHSCDQHYLFTQECMCYGTGRSNLSKLTVFSIY